MQLKEIYRPIEKELKEVGLILEASLNKSQNQSINKMTNFLLESGGKKIRSALVILSAKAAANKEARHRENNQLIKMAAGIELIHTASLVHDDVIDGACFRHHRSTINSKWGEDVSIALGDYLYSVAFELISQCSNLDILRCVTSAAKAMCEGELIQVSERDNLDLRKKRYFIIVKKKTASLFAASCQSGTAISNCQRPLQNALKQYGLNFGLAFQIVDDCLDLISETKELGKFPGADFRMGVLTLPLLNLLSQGKAQDGIPSLLKQIDKEEAFKEIKKRFINSSALLKTQEDVYSYIRKAKKNLNRIEDSCFKETLFSLADYTAERIKL